MLPDYGLDQDSETALAEVVADLSVFDLLFVSATAFKVSTGERNPLMMGAGQYGLGYRLQDHELSFKLFPGDGRYYPSIDIFTAQKDEETGRYFVGNAKARGYWPNDWWTEEELSEIVPYQFGPQIMMGCKTTQRYLSTLYGDDYMDTAYQLWNHSENTMHERLAVQIVDRNPAPWIEEGEGMEIEEGEGKE